MCLIAFGTHPSPALRLLVVANRDEFHARPSTALAHWPDQPDLIAGRDISAHGTWLGVSTRGRLAAVTNVRLPGVPAVGLKSRGALALDYLAGADTPAAHLAALGDQLVGYGPCNLLIADTQQVWYASNQPGVPVRRLGDGLYGLSNAALDTPWPKTTALKDKVAAWLADAEPSDVEPLFTALADPTQPPDAALPDTGVGLTRERFVAPAFIRSLQYGTRCSTVVMVDAAGAGVMIERRFGPEGIALGETRIEFRWPTP
ncbi:MAG: NRDE family protein [Pseudomonadota bacterium]